MLSYADYLMILSPPDSIAKEISRFKRASVNMIGHFEGMHSTPQLIVTHQIRCKPFLVQPAIDKMMQKLATMPPFEMQISGFSYFENGHSRTIYAVVERSLQCDNWFKLLFNQMGIKGKNFVPHIAIVSNIPVTAFNKLWPNFKNREFSSSFTAVSLCILQKDTFAEYCEYRIFREIFFANRLTPIF